MSRAEFITAGVKRSVHLMRENGLSEAVIANCLPMLVAAMDAWLTRQGETVH